jgi:hypothetical protein
MRWVSDPDRPWAGALRRHAGNFIAAASPVETEDNRD